MVKVALQIRIKRINYLVNDIGQAFYFSFVYIVKGARNILNFSVSKKTMYVQTMRYCSHLPHIE